MITVLVGICGRRRPDYPSLMSLIGTVLQSDEEIRIGLAFGGNGPLDASRSIMAYTFLNDPEADVLLFIDDDVVWNPVSVRTIGKAAFDKQTIVCGAYRANSPTESRLAVVYLDDKPIKIGPNGGLVECKYCATGFMAIPKNVIAKLSTLYPLVDSGAGQYPGGAKVQMFYPIFQPYYPEGVYLEEDYGFCHRCREAGFKIYIDTGNRLGHEASVILWPDGMSDTQNKMVKEVSK